MTKQRRAEELIWKFTAAAAATGAIPVPAGSAAIVAQNAAMVNAVAGVLGVPVSVSTVVASLGPVGAVNLVGRALFVEAARLAGWGTGGWGLAPVCALGAGTAALQTWLLGQLTIAICEHGGAELPRRAAAKVLSAARESFPGVAALRRKARVEQR